MLLLFIIIIVIVFVKLFITNVYICYHSNYSKVVSNYEIAFRKTEAEFPSIARLLVSGS